MAVCKDSSFTSDDHAVVEYEAFRDDYDDVEFIDPIPDSLQCPVCLSALKQPHLLSCCGSHMCEDCISPIQAKGKACPCCREEEYSTMLDKRTRGRVLGLRVRCNKDGCDWEGELGDLEKHLSKKCLYVEEVCPHGCGESFPRHLLQTHQQDECPQRPLDAQLGSLQRQFSQKYEQLQQQVMEQEKKHGEDMQKLLEKEKKHDKDKKELQQQLLEQEKKHNEDKKELQQQLIQQEKKHEKDKKLLNHLLVQQKKHESQLLGIIRERDNLDLPVKLHTKGRYECGSNMTVDGDMFMFQGGESVGVVKILEPIHPILNYFEYEILGESGETAMGIGLGETKFPLDHMPGLIGSGIGYHGDDGNTFYGNMRYKYGPLFSIGDRMGCGVDFSPKAGCNHVYVFFTVNGKQVGELIRMKVPPYGFYPVIGFRSPGERVRYLGHWRWGRGFPTPHWLRSNCIKFLDDGLTLEYDGNEEGCKLNDIGIAQANFRLTPTNHYFEMRIVDPGQDSWLALGLAKTTYPLTKHPGWAEGSIGYHADDGRLFKENGLGDPFGPTCTTGDIMGCGIKFPMTHDKLSDKMSALDINYRPEGTCDYEAGSSCTVYFTKNREVVGETECVVPKGGFYPVVGMCSKGEKMVVNFSPLSEVI